MPHVQDTGFRPLSATLAGGGAAHGKDRALQRSIRDSVADALASGLGTEAKGHGIAGLAAAIREKLRTVDGKLDAVPSVLRTIHRALDDAASKLAAEGVPQQQIDSGLARFRHKLARELAELAGGTDPAPATSVAGEKTAIAAREVVRERFSLDVLTAEGDTVSIRFKSLNVTDVAAAQVTRDGATATAVEASVISRGRFTVEVDGDLNEAERTAIANLLDAVDDIAADFFGGDVQAAFAAASRVGLESDALSAFDLKLSYSRSLAAAQAYALNAKPGTQPAPAPAEPDLVTSTPVEPVTLPAEPQAPLTSLHNAETVTDSVPAMMDAAPAVEGTPAAPAAATQTARMASALETISQFAKDVLERLDEADDSNATKFSLRWKVEFLIKAFGSVALTPIEQKAADALGISLEARAPEI